MLLIRYDGSAHRKFSSRRMIRKPLKSPAGFDLSNHPPAPNMVSNNFLTTEIVDIRPKRVAGAPDSTRAQIVAGLSRPSGQRILPTTILYDERGLRLYDNITTMIPEYYLFSAENEILKDNGDEIVRTMHAFNHGAVVPGEVVVELGAG